MKYHLPLTHPLLQTVDISVSFGGLQILDEVSIGIPEGSVTGLIGPNGAGKTTVFNVMTGFVKPDSGKVKYEGNRLRHVKTHHLTKMGISRTLQGVGLFPSLTARENVMLGASGHVRSGIVADALAMPWTDAEQRHIRDKAEAAMAELGVLSEADRLPGEMPYPVQKRVALARALVSDPKVLLLDEPAGGIGAADMRELGRLIRSWVPERTVLLVEHHMELVMEVCDLIWVLDAGKVIAAGSPEEVRNDPAVLAAYLGEDDHEGRSRDGALMLRIDALSVNYGAVEALKNVSLDVPPGRVTAVIGANGAGKSTLMRTLAGLEKPLAGRVLFNDEDITGSKPEDIVRMGIALVPEGRSTIPDLTVAENLKLGGMWRTHAQRATSLTRVYALFPVLGERRHLGADTLSGGERQQLAIGRALMTGPQALLLDEPSLGLAPLIVTQILELVEHMARDSGLAVLLVEQNAATALRVAKTGIVLNLGEIVKSGPAREIAQDEELRHAYLGY